MAPRQTSIKVKGHSDEKYEYLWVVAPNLNQQSDRRNPAWPTTVRFFPSQNYLISWGVLPTCAEVRIVSERILFPLNFLGGRHDMTGPCKFGVCRND